MSDKLPVAYSPGLIPATINEAMMVADRMASAKLVPQALQKSPGDCFLVVGLATRWGMDPFAVAQEVSVIRGHLMVSGKLTAAVVNTSGLLAERLSYEFSGEGDSRAVTVRGRLANEAEPRSVPVRLKDVKTDNEVWKKQVDQQLTYAGARIWARRHLPEVMLGVYDREEEMIDVTPSRPSLAPIATPPETVQAPPTPPTDELAVDDATGEILTPYKINADAYEGWPEFGQAFIGLARGATSYEDLEAWETLNSEALDQMKADKPKMFAGLEKTMNQLKLALVPAQ